jgi:hypothetical protein
LLATASIMHVDDELRKILARFVKKIAKKVKEEVEEFGDFQI